MPTLGTPIDPAEIEAIFARSQRRTSWTALARPFVVLWGLLAQAWQAIFHTRVPPTPPIAEVAVAAPPVQAPTSVVSAPQPTPPMRVTTVDDAAHIDAADADDVFYDALSEGALSDDDLFYDALEAVDDIVEATPDPASPPLLEAMPDLALVVPKKYVWEVYNRMLLAAVARGAPAPLRALGIRVARRLFEAQQSLAMEPALAKRAARWASDAFLIERFVCSHATLSPLTLRAACAHINTTCETYDVKKPDMQHLTAWLQTAADPALAVRNGLEAARVCAAHGSMSAMRTALLEVQRSSRTYDSPLPPPAYAAFLHTVCGSRLVAQAQMAADFGDAHGMYERLDKARQCYSAAGSPPPDTRALERDGRVCAARLCIDLGLIAAASEERRLAARALLARHRVVQGAVEHCAQLLGLSYTQRAFLRVAPDMWMNLLGADFFARYSGADGAAQAVRDAAALLGNDTKKSSHFKALHAWATQGA